MSSKRTRSSTPPEGTHPVMVRVPQHAYNALQSVAAASNTSLNAITNEAIANYLSQPDLVTRLQSDAQAKLTEAQETISKLSGDTP